MGNEPSVLQFTFIGTIVLYLGSVVLLSNRLKRYPVAWDCAGRFSLFANNTAVTGWKFLKFVFSDRYVALNDKPLAYMLWTTRTLFGIAAALFVWDIASIALPGR